MKKLLVLILALGIVPTATGQITLEVREADGETPFDCNDDIMVGTSLTIIVSSDCNDYWSGGLFIEGEDRALGTLSGRDLDPNTRDWTGSNYEDAGDFAKVTRWKDSSIWGFDLYTFYPVDGNSESNSTVAGDWFIIDYKADEVGDCNVGFYDYSISWDDPNYFLSFSHIPTRDPSSDGVVNFADFAIFAAQWDATDCNDPNWCDGADLNRDSDDDYDDLRLFLDYWLWGVPVMEAGEDSNSQQTMADGMGGMQEFQQSQSVQVIDVNEQPITIDEQVIDVDEQPIDVNEQVIDVNEQVIDVNEIVRWLEEIWVQEEGIGETYSEAEWQEFIDSVKNP